VHEVLPDVAETPDRRGNGIGFGANQYGAGGRGIAALSVHRAHVNVGFLRGSELPDPDRVLEGTGKRLRHVKLRSQEELGARWGALRRLLEGARDAGGG